jgi:type II secretory pathway pseudopilin PulG
MSFCPKCGQQLPDGSQICPSCEIPTPQPQQPFSTQPTVMGQPVKIYSLATISIVISVLGICSWGLLGILGAILGVIALVKINNSNGQLGGKNRAIGGMVAGGTTFIIGFIILPIIAAIAIPSFLTFQMKAKQAEAKVTLKEIAQYQEIYYIDNGKYGNSFEEIGVPPHMQTQRYAIFMDQSVMQPINKGPYDLPFETATYVNEDSYLLVAAGNIDSDEVLDVWVLAQDGNLVHVSDDASLYDTPNYEQGYEYK